VTKVYQNVEYIIVEKKMVHHILQKLQEIPPNVSFEVAPGVDNLFMIGLAAFFYEPRYYVKTNNKKNDRGSESECDSSDRNNNDNYGNYLVKSKPGQKHKDNGIYNDNDNHNNNKYYYGGHGYLYWGSDASCYNHSHGYHDGKRHHHKHHFGLIDDSSDGCGDGCGDDWDGCSDGGCDGGGWGDYCN